VSEGHREAARGDLWDDAQVATSLEDQTQSFARLTSEARQLTAALRRLSAGTYGQCEACAAPIPAGRLKALPTARLCVPCQERAERDGAARSTRIRIAYDFDYDFDDVLQSSPA
jgi:DnaK suppressor protein